MPLVQQTHAQTRRAAPAPAPAPVVPDTLKGLFDAVVSARGGKGPFTENYQQGSGGRVGVFETPPGTLQFQAAYRTPAAVKLATQYNLWVGNFFTTNYYEIMGEFVFGDFRSSHPLDHARLIAAGRQAMPKTNTIIRHWVLERYYLAQFPSSKLSSAFLARGVSDAANEATYAPYFFNFYLSAIQDEMQILPAFLLVKNTPLVVSSSINQARDIVAETYDWMVRTRGEGEACTKRMFDIRNGVHNSLSKNVLDDIKRFYAQCPFYLRDGNTNLGKVTRILEDYFAIRPDRMIPLAKQLGLTQVQTLATALAKSPAARIEDLLALSTALVDLRHRLIDNAQVPTSAKSTVLALLTYGSQYLSKEILERREAVSKDTLMILLNTIYMEGFLIPDNYNYFAGEIKGATDLNAAVAVVANVPEIAQDSLVRSVDGALQLWIQVEPQMEKFVDNTMKSSSINVLAVVLNRIGK